MTDYEPYPTVTFAGTKTYADNTISSISISNGRNDVIEQPQPGYSRIELWTDASEPLDVNLSDSVEIAIESATYGDGTRTNLLTNPNFETNATGWTNAQTGGVTRSTDYARSGVASGKTTWSSSSDSNAFAFLAASFSYPATGIYTVSAYFYIPVGSTLAGRTMTFTSEGGTATVTSLSSTPATLVAGTWVRASQRVNCTVIGTKNLVARLSGTLSTAIGQTIYVDDAMQEKSSTANDYFDGSSTVPIGCAWTGTANASTSTQTGINYPIFTGIVSDIEIDIDAYGSDGSIARYSITAVGPLATLNRRVAGTANFAKENDGTRILNILSEAFLTEWDDVAPLLTWADLPVGVTWASYDAVALALVDNLTANIDVPGQYELMAYTDGSADAYSLTTVAANSGRGVLWEGHNGDLHYDDYLARDSAQILTLTADDILAQGLRTAAQLGEIVNDAVVSYRAGTANSRDEQSIILYGQLTGTRDTVLHNLTDAENQAADFVAARAFPRMYPEQITAPLHSPTVTDLTRDGLISIYNGVRIQTSALPEVFGTSFDGFVEGYTWNLTRYTAELALICSAYSETYSSIIWYQLPPTTTWSGYTPSTTEWQDL